MNNNALKVSGLTASYNDQPVIEDISFEVSAGKLIGIVGPNGAGKSTLIKSIVGTHRRDRGSVEVHGLTGRAARQKIVYVPQRNSVDWDFPVTVRDVIAQGCYSRLGLLRRFSNDELQRVDSALAMVALEAFADRQIGELSGGQQQRVFLGRALAQDGQVYLLDEPFAGVDAATESSIVEVLRNLRKQGKTVMVVNHDLATVRDYFDELLLINKKLIAYGKTQEIFTPQYLQQAYRGKLTIFENSSMAVVSS